jgi:4'-phosphopantetheinyl transferase EntD
MAVREFVAADARRGLPRTIGVGIRRWTSADDVPPLLPGEAAGLGPRAAERRRLYYAMGRAAARDALHDLGVAPAAIARGATGEPIWPNGIVGAITHSGDLAMAIVGWRRDYDGLGLDVEQLSPGLTLEAARLVWTPDEARWLADGPEIWRTMLFSAKESVFKALYPIERIWLGFTDANLTFDPERSIFEARLLKQASVAHPVGAVLWVYCTINHEAVLTTTCVLAGSVQP